jgi:hypothetical protein
MFMNISIVSLLRFILFSFEDDWSIYKFSKTNPKLIEKTYIFYTKEL